MKPLRTSLIAAAFALLPFAAWSQLPPPTLAARSSLLLDMSSGQTLAASDADTKIEPASLTKLMTAYLVFAALRDKKLTPDQRPPVSAPAYKAIGSRMFVEPARPATVDELLHGMIVQSGNDASIVLAEAVAGTEAGFAELMNREAARIGMKNTRFRNATGLPDPAHYTTARDLGLLAVRLIEDFPQDYAKYYSLKEYTYNKIRQPNRNRLLFLDPSVDGVKTGHTDAAGYCLIASSRREQAGAGFHRRLLSVVTGTASESARAIESQKLLNYGFQNFEAVKVLTAGQPLGKYQVWKGAENEVSAGFEQDVFVTVAKGQAGAIKAEVERVQPLIAPVTRGQRIGTMRVKLGDQVLAERPVLALAAVDQAGLFGRAWDTIRLWMSK
ncbi:MAG TPA: D-alanyl-D-alanine carboxypeptidase family protein [Quisquiliibacterium sp.]|nr:D-alanyl-D-alanine carboxypeptidase family protein [Quisquiliibacterium sp.]